MLKTAAVTLSLVSAASAIYAFRDLRIIRLRSLRERAVWTWRSWCWNYPVPLDLEDWRMPESDDDYSFALAQRIQSIWRFLAPFFLTRGYVLYVVDRGFQLRPHPLGPSCCKDTTQPYARCFYEQNSDAEFCWESWLTWPARDLRGREDVFKLVSGRNPTKEVEVLRRMNSKLARQDPRNHCIHVIEFIEFDGLVFAVMPRWDRAFDVDFGTFAELVTLTGVPPSQRVERFSYHVRQGPRWSQLSLFETKFKLTTLAEYVSVFLSSGIGA
ncbi:hypothetical protein BDZ89DRAFT_395018 [Hymenopellis radicata]|nr:hypothetical protein BDZ89DRAFT_395018 [Hymenopellis radicata]